MSVSLYRGEYPSHRAPGVNHFGITVFYSTNGALIIANSFSMNRHERVMFVDRFKNRGSTIQANTNRTLRRVATQFQRFHVERTMFWLMFGQSKILNA